MADEESKAKEERKVEAAGSRTEVARDGEEAKGRIGVEEERKRRKLET